MSIIQVLQQVLIWLVTIFWMYQLGISLFSLIKVKEKPLLVKKNHKFMAVICARNEEKVIGNLIDSLKKQKYPADLLDIYVVADNCTDKTAMISKEAGAFVYERFEPEKQKQTKGCALQWFLNQKLQENLDYDAFCVFDADNIAMPDFIEKMNIKLCQGEEVVQGYRDIKNPTDTWITAGYTLFYWTMNRFYHLARYNLGLSPLINGTGFMVKFDNIAKTGWNTKTLTEDIEFSLINISKNKKLGWAKDAIVYDEQPLKFMQSWKQRTRWTVGHIQCLKLYTKSLANGTKEYKNAVTFDGLLYILGTLPMMLITLLLTLLNVVIYLGNGMSSVDLLINIGLYLGATFLLPILSSLIVMKVEKREIKPMIKGITMYPFFLGSWLLINIKCLFKQDTTWVQISHTRNVEMDEISKVKELA